MKTSTERMIAKKDGPIGWMQFNNQCRVCRYVEIGPGNYDRI